VSDLASAWIDYAPRVRWVLPAATPTQRVFVVVLSADGLCDYELPVSTIMVRLRDTDGSYVRCTVPDPVRFTAEILPRAAGRMTIFGGEKESDGTRHLEEILYANIQRIYLDEGNTNVLTLAGTRYQTFSSPRAVTLTGISQLALSSRGRYTARAALDFFLRPGDRVTAAGVSFTADLVTLAIRAADAVMTVEGVA
jgi:hypothetical protein